MKKEVLVVALCFLIGNANSISAGDSDVKVEMEIRKDESDAFADITISNASGSVAKLQHPANRSTVSFVVYDKRFNLITPVGIGKADPPRQEIVLKSGETFSYAVKPYTSDGRQFLFSYVTGTAWYGYLLEKGERYRVVAIYRGSGPDSAGVCSGEKVFEY